MENKMKNNIITYSLIEPGDTILAAVSGGPDSMAMLFCLDELKEQISFNLVIAHVNHGVRGKEAERDQLFVESISKELRAPFHTINVDMIGYGKELGISSEEAGRILRYGFFREVLKGYGKGKIAVAHNMNDQAETLLFRLMRGTGINGLQGMSFASDDIIRPLLNITRDEIEEYITEKGIETVQDHTNLEAVYSRNKIRLEMLPYIKENFNPNIIEGLFRLSMTAADDIKIIDDVIEKKYKMVVKKQEHNSIIFKGKEFNHESEGIRRRLIRKALQSVKGDLHGIDEKHIDAALDIFEGSKTGTSINLPSWITASVSYEDLSISIGKVTMEKLPDFILQLGRNYPPGWDMEIELDHIDLKALDIQKGMTAYLDAETLTGDLVLRQRIDGDRFSPIGLNGSKKLKDYFIDNKVAREQRERVPIIADSKGIVWVVGHTIDQRSRISKQTKRVLRIRCSNPTIIDRRQSFEQSD